MFARAIFEAIVVKGGRMVKKWDIEAERTSLKAFSHQRRAKPFNTLRSK